MTLETVRLSQRAKDQLIKLKRNTGIKYWNELCRWGFCLSLSEPGAPPIVKIPVDSNIEMSWTVFGGRYADLYMALLKMRLHHDDLPLDKETLALQFRLHLHRGISYLAGIQELRSIEDLTKLAIESDDSKQLYEDSVSEGHLDLIAPKQIDQAVDDKAKSR